MRGQLGVGESGVLPARFEGRSDLTPFARAPWAVPVVCAALVALALPALAVDRRPSAGLISSPAPCSPPNCSSASAA